MLVSGGFTIKMELGPAEFKRSLVLRHSPTLFVLSASERDAQQSLLPFADFFSDVLDELLHARSDARLSFCCAL
jgi:hypothetical protein